ncbi:uncharacterized protein [Triticum aestivum]|uniref:uncharacterized protein isoform X1 n=1 Tax=Triticum aestivum TaxID=4565 RepID=UPI001D024F88|nr:uncharacterized protein LOC123188253 isoform X1 [Triticum aestivum]XP_044456231.1 uncharacterized protein LOC123188253 isoform X1 [Triticum aestivum]XP_044456232.1 uncharacterized protein LOC123188253 isoform X1 [Triticum aestivum]
MLYQHIIRDIDNDNMLALPKYWSRPTLLASTWITTNFGSPQRARAHFRQIAGETAARKSAAKKLAARELGVEYKRSEWRARSAAIAKAAGFLRQYELLRPPPAFLCLSFSSLNPPTVMGKHKLTLKTEEDSNPRDKYITWTDEATRFMLEWYIDLRKDKPATFKFKKQHHLQCADALNGKFSLGVTQTQVDRHYRQCKEKWGWKTAVNYLTRPIRFFHQLEELFSDQSHADGSLAVDQTTVNVDDGSDDSEDVRELEGNLIPADSDEADSDTIDLRSPKVDLDGNPLNKKRKCASSSPSKKPTKGKANKKGKVPNDDMVTSIKKLAESLASPIVSVQPMPPADPYANLWKRINALTIPAKDKLEIVAYLSKPDQDIFRSYLNYADETILREWVISYFEPQFHEGGNDGSAAAH